MNGVQSVFLLKRYKMFLLTEKNDVFLILIVRKDISEIF